MEVHYGPITGYMNHIWDPYDTDSEYVHVHEVKLGQVFISLCMHNI